MGPPGSGKNRICKVLAASDRCIHFSSGEFLRKQKDSSYLSTIANGNYINDEDMLLLVEDYLKNFQNQDEQKILIFDGFPRTLSQAKAFTNSNYIKFPLRIICLCVDEDILIKRLQYRSIQEHRADDADTHVIKHRIEQYYNITQPIFKYFTDTSECRHFAKIINAGRDIFKVCYDIFAIFQDL